jgi:hypothetical protein
MQQKFRSFGNFSTSSRQGGYQIPQGRVVARISGEPLSQEKILEGLDIDVSQEYLFLQVYEMTQDLTRLTSEIKKLKKLISEASKKIITKNIFINNLRNSEYKLLSPLSIVLESEGGCISANCYDINQYGVGDNEEEAINNLCEIIIEYFECLIEDQDKLGVLPTKHWIYLKEVISKRQ